MTNKIKYNKTIKDNDNVLLLDFDFVNDFVLYYDNVNDIVFVNDFDFDLKSNNDNDFVYIDNDIDFVLKSNINYTLLDNVKKIRQCYNDIDNINDIINDIDFVNVNKYVYDIKKVNDIDFIFDNVLNDSNVYLLDINNDIDFKNNDNDFVLLKMNKDIYNDNYYDFVKDNVFLLSYCLYNYDNDNVNVIIDRQRLNYVLNNLDYNYMTLSLKKTYSFLNSQIDKNMTLFNNYQSQYFKNYLKKDKKSQRLCQRLIKVGKAKQSNINKLQSKLNNVNDNIKDITMLQQYIIKNNCYYDNLNDLKNNVYKSFKDIGYLIDLKKSLNDFKKDIDNDNDNVKVNQSFKNKFSDINNNIVFDKDYDININVYIDKDNMTLNYDNLVNDIKKVIKDLKINNDIDKGYVVKDIIKDFEYKQSDILSQSHYLDYLLNDNDFINLVNDIFNDIDIIKDIILNNDIIFDNDILNDIIIDYKKLFKNYDFDIVKDLMIKSYNKDKDIVNVLKYQIKCLDNDFYCLDIFIDFLVNLKVKENVNENIYEYNIFDSHMNKHNSIIKVEQSNFLKVAYNENLNDYYYTE